MRKALNVIIPIMLLFGCAINQEVIPLASNLQVQKIYIKRNYDKRFDATLDIIIRKLEEKNIDYKIANGSIPSDAEFYLDYGGEFSWDFKTYMSKFVVNIYQNRRIIAGAEYNAKSGGLNLGKFSDIEAKIESIIDECFSNL